MSVNQRNASAGRDVIGRDKIEVYPPPERGSTKLEKLKERLRQEVADNQCAPELIDRLQNYQRRTPEDGVVGLEAKLEVAGRSDQRLLALEMKEQFAKLLDKWSLYASAQEIFVHLLAMAEHKYVYQIYPRLADFDGPSIDEMIEQRIICPAIEEVGIDVFSLDHQTAMGMVYWLAEQCRIRWHK